MMADPRPDIGLARLDDDKVESEAQGWEGPSVRQRAGRHHRPGGIPEMAALPEVDRFLGQPERPGCAQADFDDHESLWRARVDRHEIELVATDMDVPGEDRPAGLRQPFRDEGFGTIAGSLGPRAASNHHLAIHARIVAGAAYLAITARFIGTQRTRGRWT